MPEEIDLDEFMFFRYLFFKYQNCQRALINDIEITHGPETARLYLSKLFAETIEE